MEEKVCIIIPCFNEQENILHVISEARQFNPNATILVVNDGSTDQTESIVKSSPDTVLINLPFNLGVGSAVQTGFIFARRNNFDFAVKLDGDLQHPPEFIFDMLRTLKSSRADLVIGSRFLTKKGFKSSFGRRFGIRLLRTLTFLLTGKIVTDPTSGFRIYSKQAIKFMADNYPSFDYPEPEEIILAIKNGLLIKETPVQMRERKFGESSISSVYSVYYMIKVCLAMLFIYLRRPEKEKRTKDVG